MQVPRPPRCPSRAPISTGVALDQWLPPAGAPLTLMISRIAVRATLQGLCGVGDKLQLRSCPPPHTPTLGESVAFCPEGRHRGGTHGRPDSLLPGVRSPSGFPLLVPASSAQVSGARRLCEGSRAPGAPGWLCPRPHTPQSPSRAGVTSLKDRRSLGCARIPVSEVSRACREVFPGKGEMDGGGFGGSPAGPPDAVANTSRA